MFHPPLLLQKQDSLASGIFGPHSSFRLRVATKTHVRDTALIFALLPTAEEEKWRPKFFGRKSQPAAQTDVCRGQRRLRRNNLQSPEVSQSSCSPLSSLVCSGGSSSAFMLSPVVSRRFDSPEGPGVSPPVGALAFVGSSTWFTSPSTRSWEDELEDAGSHTSVAAVIPMMWRKMFSHYHWSVYCAAGSSLPQLLPQSMKLGFPPTVAIRAALHKLLNCKTHCCQEFFPFAETEAFETFTHHTSFHRRYEGPIFILEMFLQWNSVTTATVPSCTASMFSTATGCPLIRSWQILLLPCSLSLSLCLCLCG